MEGSSSISSYQLFVNGVVLQSGEYSMTIAYMCALFNDCTLSILNHSTGSDFPIEINTNIPQFRDGLNEVMMNLLGATEDVVFQEIFNIDIVRRA